MLHCSGEMYPENLLPQLPRVVKWSCKEYAGFKDLSKIPVVTEQKKRKVEMGACSSIHVML